MCFQRIRDWFNKIFNKKEPEPLPALANTFLFAEPQQHYLEYSSKVLHDLIVANKGGQDITELIGVDASTAKVKVALTSKNPIVFAMAGHGNYNTTTLECTEMFMQVGNENVPLMNGRIVHTNSCECAAELGPAIIAAGAIAYVGSKESFWFYTGDAANTTRAVRSPFLCEWQFEVSLLQGKSVADARADMMKKYEEELSYWVEGDGKTHPDSAEIARIININKSVSTFLGEGAETPSPGGGAGGLALPPEVAMSASFAGTFAILWWLLR